MAISKASWIAPLLLAGLGGAGCGGSEPEAAPPAASASAAPAEEPAEVPVPEGPTLETSVDAEGAHRAQLRRKFTDDFPGMRKRRVIRALVTYNHTQYFLDGPTQRGIAYEALQLFEKHLNAKYKTGNLPIYVIVVPVTRDQLLARLATGYGDIAVGGLTITGKRQEEVDFSTPTATDISEIVVTGPAGPASLASVDDLSGQEVWVRRSSSHYESLVALNERLKAAGRPPVRIRAADELLESEDLLEMTNAGLIGITVVDDYLGRFWAGVFKDIRLHPDLKLRTGGELAWAVRKGAPRLLAEVNEFVARNRKGTLMGNVLIKKYLGTVKWAQNAFGDEDLARFRGMIGFFQKYADRYRFDWLLCAAQGYQESQLDQSKRSHVGAIGVMQVMPATARDRNVNIPDIDKLEPNIHAGIKYLRWVVDNYFDDAAIDPLNQELFAFASYNAGPNRIARLRKEAAAAGLDPNVWFRNVELVVARRVGREPVQYVSNIYKYYLAYRTIAEQRQREEQVKEKLKTGDASPGSGSLASPGA
jgi:membrane-bound lytic murein transglycosylase MltF